MVHGTSLGIACSGQYNVRPPSTFLTWMRTHSSRTSTHHISYVCKYTASYIKTNNIYSRITDNNYTI